MREKESCEQENWIGILCRILWVYAWCESTSCVLNFRSNSEKTKKRTETNEHWDVELPYVIEWAGPAHLGGNCVSVPSDCEVAHSKSIHVKFMIKNRFSFAAAILFIWQRCFSIHVLSSFFLAQLVHRYLFNNSRRVAAHVEKQMYVRGSCHKIWRGRKRERESRRGNYEQKQ